ncbi:hypothetical protein Scep_022349 [Stephania cephalantha]|uniref:Uncharacterized protein n=1 Tax=Stephania cephalantha TaxID=152367 RepID=A0AAP0F580_9MAGN
MSTWSHVDRLTPISPSEKALLVYISTSNVDPRGPDKPVTKGGYGVGGGRGHGFTVRRGRRLFKEGRGKTSVERDTAEGGRMRGRLCERDWRRCTRATEKEERRIVGAPEQGAAAMEALISSSGSGTWRKSRQWYVEEEQPPRQRRRELRWRQRRKEQRRR